MNPITYILLTLAICIGGAFNITYACESIQNGQYFRFGLSVMYVVSLVVLMVFISCKLYGGV